MKRPSRRRSKRRVKVIRLWKYPEAVRAVPYLAGLLGSVRENWLSWKRHELDLRRLDGVKRDRTSLIRREDAQKEARRAGREFRESLRELRKIDVFLVDPVESVAFIPFQQGEELAWMVYDRFDEKGLAGWRFHRDDLEARRPLADLTAAAPLAAPSPPPALPPSAA